MRANNSPFRMFAPCAFLMISIVLVPHPLTAESIAVHHQEGVSHGFPVIHSLDGKILATGEMIQIADGNKVTTEIVFHFKDGSLYDEKTVFSQDRTFRLLSDHLIQKGPFFPHPIDIVIDCSKNEITLHASDKGKEKDSTQHMDLPEDLADGMILTLLRNLSPSTSETKVSMLTTSSKPRLIKLSITPKGERSFTAGGTPHKACDFAIHAEIGGVAGAIAPVIGKQPPDTHIWMTIGAIPTFVRFEGPLYDGGPIVRADLPTLRVPDGTNPHSTQKRLQKQ
ncbi:MAG: hypothetical protein JWQ87_3706 [Candidatus Sulfotelmatobacter sp.]|nr:hypothetical protein [Candidatus Sulfotelmatobacter sp.]